eukprot:364219-Chlamydomonas_euryale.AAC.3
MLKQGKFRQGGAASSLLSCPHVSWVASSVGTDGTLYLSLCALHPSVRYTIGAFHRMLLRCQDVHANPCDPTPARTCPHSSPNRSAFSPQGLEDNVGVINLDTADVRVTDETLYKWLVSYPHEVMPMFDMHVSGEQPA